MSKQFVKVQIPLASSDPNPRALIYDKNMKHMTQQQLTPAMLRALGNDVKAFFEAEYDSENQQWIIGKRVINQLW